MIIQPTESLALLYIYSNQTEKNWKHCTLRYRLNNEQTWVSQTDRVYPFEFDLKLPHVSDIISFELIGTDKNGHPVSFPVQRINSN